MATSKTTPFSKEAAEAVTEVLPIRAPADPDDLRLEFSAQTHVGNVRLNNEDQFLIVRLSKTIDVLATSLTPEQQCHLLHRDGYFLLVADGMGGHSAGERASAMVVNEAVKHVLETAKWFFRLDDPDETIRLRLLREALERVDRKLIAAGETHPDWAGMGTTLTALSLVGADAFIVHVGDSRAYLLRDGTLEQLTKDHTRAQQLVDLGLLRPEDVRTNRLRHVLTNVIGGREGVEGEVVKLRLLDGDRLLLCTDGLNEPVRDEQIAEILTRSANPADACRALIDAALSRGGPDNVTVVVVAAGMAADDRVTR